MSRYSGLKPENRRARKLRQEDELHAAAVHVRYEMDMLECSSFYVPIGLSSPAVEVTKNIALEAFLLHYRNLRAFLCPSLQQTSPDDVIASDFLGKTVQEDIGDRSLLGHDKTRIDRLLAHISYSRENYVARGEKEWNPAEMLEILRREMAKFFGQLSAERCAWFGVQKVD